jgi:hypothetical protein
MDRIRLPRFPQRPKGSCNKLSDAFLQALADDFEAHGKGVVEKVLSAVSAYGTNLVD